MTLTSDTPSTLGPRTGLRSGPLRRETGFVVSTALDMTWMQKQGGRGIVPRPPCFLPITENAVDYSITRFQLAMFQ